MVDLPADLGPGEYQVAVGLYDPLTGQRQATVDPLGNRADFLLLPEPLVARR